MAFSNRQAALKIELVYEGGKVDHPRDPGGRTNQGITQRVYNSYRIKKGLAPQDVFDMASAERDEIYNVQYFDAVKFDKLPAGVDLVLVDGAINSGPAQSIKWLQRALGLPADGSIGEVTMERLNSVEDYDLLIAAIIDRRIAFLKALTTWDDFGRGWLKRCATVKAKGQAWAVGSVGPDVTPINGSHHKAPVSSAKKPPMTAPADATASGGVVSGGLTTAQTTLQPMAESSQFVQHLLTFIIVLGVVATVGGLLWGWYARRKRDELADVLDLVQQLPQQTEQEPQQ